jgi:hypothetical protein
MPINVLWMGESGSQYAEFLSRRGYKLHVPTSIAQAIRFLRNPPKDGFSGYVTELDIPLGKDYRENEGIFLSSGREEDDIIGENTDFLEFWENGLIGGVPEYEPKKIGVIIADYVETFVSGIGLPTILDTYDIERENIVDDEILENPLQVSIFVGKICQIG